MPLLTPPMTQRQVMLSSVAAMAWLDSAITAEAPNNRKRMLLRM
jgi:hypothetical protein